MIIFQTILGKDVARDNEGPLKGEIIRREGVGKQDAFAKEKLSPVRFPRT